MHPAENSPSWLTYEQAAAELGCSTKTIQRLVRGAALTAHRRPGTTARLVSAAEVAALATPLPVAAK